LFKLKILSSAEEDQRIQIRHSSDKKKTAQTDPTEGRFPSQLWLISIKVAKKE
jgi:hypothetical protein